MLLNHIGYAGESKRLDMAIDVCTQFEKKVVVTGRATGAKGSEFADYLLKALQDPQLERKWAGRA